MSQLILRPWSNTDDDLAGATVTDETVLPQTLAALASGSYELGRIAWDTTEHVVTDPASGADWAAIFGSGEVGFVGEFNTANTTLYQEITGAAATTVADAQDDPVGTIKCEVTGTYLVAPSTGARATLDINGALWSLRPVAGTYYDATISFTNDEAYCCAVIDTINTRADSERIFSIGEAGQNDYNHASRAVLLARAGSAESWQIYRQSALVTAAVSDDTLCVLEAGCDATDAYIEVNGAPGTPATYGSKGNYNVSKVTLLANTGSGTNQSDSHVYGFCLINRMPTAGERASIRTTLGAKGGLPL